MPKKKKTTSLKAYNTLLFSGVLWGFASLFFKMSLVTLSIGVFLALRFIIGAIFIYATGRKKFKPIPNKLLIIVALFALIDMVVINYLYSYALQRTTILHVSIISLSVPFLVYFFAAIILKEKPHRAVILGSVIAASGLAFIVVGGPTDTVTSPDVARGDAVMVIYAIIGALAIVLSRKLLGHKRSLSSEQFSFIEYVTAACFFIGLVFVTHSWSEVTTISAVTWGWIAGAAILSGAMPLLLYYKAVKILPAERLADVNFIAPAVAGCVGVIFLGEQLSTSFIIGTACVVAGLLVSHKKIHPVLIAHHIGVDTKILQNMFRVPKRAYAFIAVETKNSLNL